MPSKACWWRSWPALSGSCWFCLLTFSIAALCRRGFCFGLRLLGLAFRCNLCITSGGGRPFLNNLNIAVGLFLILSRCLLTVRLDTLCLSEPDLLLLLLSDDPETAENGTAYVGLLCSFRRGLTPRGTLFLIVFRCFGLLARKGSTHSAEEDATTNLYFPLVGPWLGFLR